MIDPRHTGYTRVMNRLRRVQRICGVERVYMILAQHGVHSLPDLDPAQFATVMYQCEFVLLAASIWDVLLQQSMARGFVRNHSKTFRESVDQWFDACDQELRLTSPDLYSDEGKPL